MQITDKDIQMFRERAKTELQSNGAVGRLAWDAIVNALCNEVEELRKNAAPGNSAAMRLCDELIQAAYDADICSPGDLAHRVRKIKDAIGPSPLGNAAAMREALEFAEDELWALGAFDSSKRVAAALAAPPRNCDVGTPEEQDRRFNAFCAVHHFQSEKCCSGCPCHGGGICEFKWGQLPYEGKGESNE